jgi:integrase
MRHLEMEKHIPVGPFYKQFSAPREEISILTLSPDRLQFLIFNQDFYENLPSNLQQSLDRLLIGCATALRFSDLNNLKCGNLEYYDKSWFVANNSQKTSTITKVKLPEFLNAVVRRNYSRARKAPLFPKIALINFNKHLKQIFELAGWTEAVDKIRLKNGKEKAIRKKGLTSTQSYRFCDLASSHIMRRSAITNMLIMGMPEHMVKMVSGHSKGSRDFYRYINLVQPYLDKEIDKVHLRMAERALV